MPKSEDTPKTITAKQIRPFCITPPFLYAGLENLKPQPRRIIQNCVEIFPLSEGPQEPKQKFSLLNTYRFQQHDLEEFNSLSQSICGAAKSNENLEIL